MTKPKYYYPTPAESGKSGYRKAREGFEIVFTMPKAKDVVCRFSARGTYEGATGLGTFTEEDDAMEDPLKDPLR
jgi:hypothetical protein